MNNYLVVFSVDSDLRDFDLRADFYELREGFFFFYLERDGVKESIATVKADLIDSIYEVQPKE